MDKRYLLLKNCRQLVTCDSGTNDDPGLRENQSLLIDGKLIKGIGEAGALTEGLHPGDIETVDCSELVVLPGYVDCHTHLVFGGSRLDEYIHNVSVGRKNVNGEGKQIGIGVSIELSRQESKAELVRTSLEKLGRMHRQGTTTVEIKSGYGMDLETEVKQLEVVAACRQRQTLDLYATYLGGHYWDPVLGKEKYLAYVQDTVMPYIGERQLADFCDIWVDEGYYTAEEAEKYLMTGRQYGMASKMHTDCYSDIGGSKVGAKLKAMSVDHLNFTSDESIALLAKAGVIGVVLPGTDYSVRHPKPVDPVRLMEGGMAVALATNFNPGNWIDSMHIIMALACRNHRMSPAEAIIAATRNGARALGLRDRGILKEGLLADIQIWNTDRYENAVYKFGTNPVAGVIKSGQATWWDTEGGQLGL